MNHKQHLEKARNFADIFEIVKNIVNESLGLEQAGIMIGISDLGMAGNGFIGAFYSLTSNMIIINKRPLDVLTQTNPPLYKHYVFHVMLHEYLHSVGILDEMETRQLSQQLSDIHFGKNHLVTQLASDIGKFMPDLAYPNDGFIEPEDMNIEFVKGIDRKNINYIN